MAEADEVPLRIMVRQEGIARLQDERDEAVTLLERVLFLRMNGERAPGGNETWPPLDRDIEAYLRRGLPGGKC